MKHAVLAACFRLKKNNKKQYFAAHTEFGMSLAPAVPPTCSCARGGNTTAKDQADRQVEEEAGWEELKLVA